MTASRRRARAAIREFPPGTRRPGFHGCRDRGSATVWLLASGLVLLSAGLAAAAVGAAHVARHQAQAAADLGVLAGAAHAVEGSAVACARAGELVAANAGRLVRCEQSGLELVVTVEVIPAVAFGSGRVATATARAGPIHAAS